MRPLYATAARVYKRRMPGVEVRLLGPLEIGVSGRRVELRRPKQRALLALLALRPGEVVSVDRLIDELWGGTAPKAAVGSLQNLVSELRKALGPELLLTRPPGYVLEIDRMLVDAHRFERIVGETERAADRRATMLREALGLWRGPALADLAFEPFATAEIARLEELRAAAMEDLFAAELELGRHAPLVAKLEAFVVEHPLRERARGQLLLALYRSGRQVDALEEYRAARETLVEELGIDPSPELQRLEQAILRHDPSLDARRPAPSLPGEPERRKTVTVLFADVVDSSALAAELDPEVLRTLMRSYFDVVRTVVERHEGTVEKFIGDAAMAVFGIPAAHEDDALRAARAATELHSEVAEIETGHGVAVRIRVGVNTGEVLVTDPATGESFVTGSAVVVATRLQEAALPGETLIGATTQRLVRHATESEAVEPLDLGGALGRVPASRLLGLVEESAGLRLGRTPPLVGRIDELARLRAELAGARSERKSRVVTVIGDAGIGKTRLAAELASSADATVLVGRCVPYGEGTTYLPLAEAVRQAVPQRLRARVAALLAENEHAEVVAQRMAELTGEAEGAGSTGEVFWAARLFLEALAAERPVLLVLDDVHWAEPTLLDLVEYLAAWVSEAPLLVLCLARPDLLETRPGWAARAVRLEPLSPEESSALVGGLAEVTEDVRVRVVEVAEGNALFVEQLLAYVVEDEGPAALDSLPPSVEALLAGRLDRLQADERALLERAAVVGRRFPRAAVIHLSPPDELAGIEGCLATLVRKGLIRVGGSATSNDDAFRFYHALVREVAYTGITKEHRSDLHERHGGWLEQRDGPPEIVGYHLEQAHRYRRELRPSDPSLARLAIRAGEQLARSGIKAWKRADTPAAVNLLGRAVSLLPAGGSRSELECELAIALRTGGEGAQAHELLRRAIDDAAPDDRRIELRARIELAQMLLLASPEASDELLALAEVAIPVFEAAEDHRSLGRVWLHVAYVEGGVRCQNAARLAATERALDHYRRSGWSPAGCMAELAAALYYGPTSASAAVQRCTELLQETATDRAAAANLTLFLGGLEAMRGNVEAGRELAASARSAFEEIGLSIGVANSYGAVAAAIELAGDSPDAAETTLRESCEQLEQMHEIALLATRAAELADVLLAAAKDDEAGRFVRLARELAAADDVDAQSSWRLVQARLEARRGHLAQAEALARDAVALASGTDMLNRQGAALLALGEVLLLAGRSREAAKVVEDAVRRFEQKENVAVARQARRVLGDLVAT
jgi:DNA-binding SARP family transcriptional activator/tetratricopeptide (TPR) repeat protein